MKRLHRRAAQPAFPYQSDLGQTRIAVVWQASLPYIQSVSVKAKGLGKGKGGQGKGPTRKAEQPRPASLSGVRHALVVQRKRVPPATSAPTPKPSAEPGKGLMRPEPVASLLATPRRQKLLEHL